MQLELGGGDGDRLIVSTDPSLPTVAVVGMGYVGLTFASLLATVGYKVHGVEKDARVIDVLTGRQSHLVEPGVEGAIRAHMGANWTVSSTYDGAPDVAVICVSTPLNLEGIPDLLNLKEACAALASVIADGALVIVRSTVPIGTTRRVVLPYFAGTRVRLAFCPERTIQGQALRELRELPQVIGGMDQESLDAAEAFFAGVVSNRVRVSSLEAAEMVKLVNNCHTDVIYSYGNEVALIAKEFALDPVEVIRAANIDYPRPDLATPGFVGGACLTKDPYILTASLHGSPGSARLIRSARALNERMPVVVAEHLLALLARSGVRAIEARILLCGFAYKGVPETDDMRGSPVPPFLDAVQGKLAGLMGHDFVVPADVIASYGVEPVELEAGLRSADGVIFLNNHPRYATLDLAVLRKGMKASVVLYDCWRIFPASVAASLPGVTYAGIGYDAV